MIADIFGQELDNLNTDNLMRLQVQQLEKEKKDMQERTRIIAKRLDHIERAFRKEERPLLDHDYEQQQAEDRIAFEIAKKTRLEAARRAHEEDLETKNRLSRVMEDYKARREYYISKRGDEFAKLREDSARKIEKEKAKRREAVLKAREEERRRIEEEERILREKEEEERRLEEGLCILYFLTTLKLIGIKQNVLQKRRGSGRKRRRRRLQRKQRNVRRKRKGLNCVDSAKRNVRKPFIRHSYSDSARRRLKPDVHFVVNSHLSLQLPLWLRSPLKAYGDVGHQLHQPPRLVLLLHRPVQKARLMLQNSALLHCVATGLLLGAGVPVVMQPRSNRPHRVQAHRNARRRLR